MPQLPAAFGRAATTLVLLASVACTGSSSPTVPTPGPTATASPSPPDPRAQERFAVAAYCLDAVGAIDARASDDDEAFEEALAGLEDDVGSLPTDHLRKEARDLVRFLEGPTTLPKNTFALIEWRLQHTPGTCLDVSGVVSELTTEQREELPTPPTRATTRWFGRADNGLLLLSVLPLTVPDDDCSLHTFPIEAGSERRDGAFRSDCRSWGKNNRHNFVMVELATRATAPPRFALADITALDQGGKLHSPVDVRSEANEPENFLPPQGIITSDGTRGFVVFDAPDLQLQAIVFHQGGELLIVIFEGKEQVVPRSSR